MGNGDHNAALPLSSILGKLVRLCGWKKIDLWIFFKSQVSYGYVNEMRTLRSVKYISKCIYNPSYVEIGLCLR